MAMTIWRMVVASLAVWRLSRLLFSQGKRTGRSQAPLERQENIFGNRVLDGICWLSVWLSAQTALWVAGGLAGVLLNWFVLSTLSRLLTPSKTTDDGPLSLEIPMQLRKEVPHGDILCLTTEHRMQVSHG